MSSKGNRTIAIVNGPEKYKTLKSSLSSAISEINSVISDGHILVDREQRTVDLYLGGDYKFLLMAMGMKRATSDYACLWCNVWLAICFKIQQKIFIQLQQIDSY